MHDPNYPGFWTGIGCLIALFFILAIELCWNVMIELVGFSFDLITLKPVRVWISHHRMTDVERSWNDPF